MISGWRLHCITQVERVSAVEARLADLPGRLAGLEQADLYLQEAHKVLAERTGLVERYSRYLEEKLKLVTVPAGVMEDKQAAVLGDLHQRLASLENTKTNGIHNNNAKNNANTNGNTNGNRNGRTDTLIRKKNDNELMDKYTSILGKVEKMESLLETQSRELSQFSEQQQSSTRETREVVRQERLEQVQVERFGKVEERVKVEPGERMSRDLLCLRVEVENIKRRIHYLPQFDSTPGPYSRCCPNCGIHDFIGEKTLDFKIFSCKFIFRDSGWDKLLPEPDDGGSEPLCR